MDSLVWALLIVILLLSGILGTASTIKDAKINRLERRLAELERKLDAVLGHLDIEPAEPEYPEVHALLQQGKKIQAIKVYREHTGAGLREAKEAVDHLAGR